MTDPKRWYVVNIRKDGVAWFNTMWVEDDPALRYIKRVTHSQWQIVVDIDGLFIRTFADPQRADDAVVTQVFFWSDFVPAEFTGGE